VPAKLHRGWHLLWEANQATFLGVSMSEALPLDSVETLNTMRPPELVLAEQKEAGLSERASKQARLN
jgi:hypothetical protein